MRIFVKIILLTLFLSYVKIYAQSPYTEKDQKFFKAMANILSLIEIERTTESFIDYDYIHESYKRNNPRKDSFSSRTLYELSTIEFHMNTLIGVNLGKKRFGMPDMYLSLGKSFHYDWIFSATPFATLSGKFGIFDKNKTTGNIELYDAGIETITLTRILLSFRMKAANDINGSTFMLIPSVVDSATENFNDIPHWYIPRVNNEMGFRTGLIGHYFELSYSQGFSDKSSPLAVLFKINGDFFKTQFLYQHEKNNLSPNNYGYNNTRNIIQIYAMGKLPLLDRQIWINMLGEYTWREKDAHYLRFELGLEWKIFNIAMRPLFYINDNKNCNDKDFDKDFKEKRDLFCLEYCAYLKFNSVYFGFQGATDGRYYIALKALF